jgi:hypothetical protein
MSNIDEKTSIPIVWVAGLFSTGMAVTIIGCFWVFQVNDRLARIEGKLGIEKIAAGPVIEKVLNE